MKSKSLLEGIKSKYIIRQIFSFQKETKAYKIVAHSKIFQNIMNISLQNYKEKFFEFFNGINLLKCLTTKTDKIMHLYPENPKALQEIYNKEMEKCKIKKKPSEQIIEEFSENYFTNIYNDYKSKEEINKTFLDNQLIIDIYSPLYEQLNKKEIFEKLFILRIPFKLLNQKKFLNDYYNAINLLNEVNPKFSSFFFDVTESKVGKFLFDFKEFIDHFKNIKKLIIKNRSKDWTSLEILSNRSVKNNLIYLEIINEFRAFLPSNILTKINELKVLEELRLENVCNFYLTKTNIKYLHITNSEISFDSKCFENLEILSKFNNSPTFPDNYSQKKIPMEKIIKFQTSFCDENFKHIFDLKTFYNLKYFIRLNIHDFLNLGENLLEKVYIRDSVYCEKSLGDEINMIKKLIGIKTLKEIKIDIRYLKEENIAEIEGENPSVEKLIINWTKYSFDNNFDNENRKIIFNSLQKKFPNLKEFQIYIYDNNFNYLSEKNSILEINQDNNCKINKFKFSGGNNRGTITIFNTAPFENLEEVEFSCMGPSFNYEESFPLFNKDCNIVFKSLSRFKFVGKKKIENNNYFDKEILRNVINNLDKMPNLKSFIFNAPFKKDKMLFKKFIKKLLSRNIKNIDFNLDIRYLGNIDYYDDCYYSEKELENIYEGIDFTKFENIKIKKI